MADTDLIARLYLDSFPGTIGQLMKLNPTRGHRAQKGYGPDPPLAGEGDGFPKNNQLSTLRYRDYLELRFSERPKSHHQPGFVFGTNAEACNIILPPEKGISGRQFTITFENNFADTNEYRLVLKDLDSKNGTIVKYGGKGGEPRRNFRWILSDTGMNSRIVIKLSELLQFDLVVFAHPICGTLIEKVERFLRPPPMNALIDRLSVKTGLKTAKVTHGLAEDAKPIVIEANKLGQGGFAIVMRHWNVSTGSSFARKTPRCDLGEEALQTFKNEHQLLRGLRHVSISSFEHPSLPL